MNRLPIPTTYEEALKKGFTLGDLRLERGYVSRRINCGKQPLIQVGRGKRRGEYFVRLPCPFSTRFCFRQYLTPPEK